MCPVPIIFLTVCVWLWNVFIKNTLPIKLSSVLSVVWKLGDHAVVEWLVAQRGVCHLCLLSWSQLCWTNVEYGEFCSLEEIHPSREYTCWIYWMDLFLSCLSRVLTKVAIEIMLMCSLQVYDHATMQNTNISRCIFQKDLIVLNEIIGVMTVDALASSHPLSSKEEDILKPEDISALFDSITYSKVWYNWG